MRMLANEYRQLILKTRQLLKNQASSLGAPSLNYTFHLFTCQCYAYSLSSACPENDNMGRGGSKGHYIHQIYQLGSILMKYDKPEEFI